MSNCKCSYEPQEDSTMLEKHVRQYAFGKVLDMGTGSGIQAIAAAQSSKVKSVLAADIQSGTVNYCKKTITTRKIKFMQSDLFENINGKFDTIIFNPPYLPNDIRIKDPALDGGKNGYEVIEKFMGRANDFLEKDGIILVLFSSLTKKEKVDKIIMDNLLDQVELESANFFFEQLHVCLLKKSEILKKIESEKISQVKYLAKGHRGIIFTGTRNKIKVVIKMKNPKSTAEGKIQNEAKWLKILNKKNIGPRVLFSRDTFFVYKYIEGKFIMDFLKSSNKRQIKKILKEVFIQMHELDKMDIDKEEMHHPQKHVIVSGSSVFLIDFERIHKVRIPKNVTQFCQFITGGHITQLLADKGIRVDRNEMTGLAKFYKKDMTFLNFSKIVKLL